MDRSNGSWDLAAMESWISTEAKAEIHEIPICEQAVAESPLVMKGHAFLNF